MKRAGLLLALFASAALGQTHVIDDSVNVTTNNFVIVKLTIHNKDISPQQFNLYRDDKYIGTTLVDGFSMGSVWIKLPNLEKGKIKPYMVCSSKVVDGKTLNFKVCSIYKAKQV